jgi:antitoxin component YwqK of YwqJK toxin-antitoxin module
MKRLLILMIIISGASALMGQNQLDDQDRKTGPWRVEYPNGKTLYEGNFLAGKPVGLMTRFYNTGSVRAKMWFDNEQDRSHAELFYKGSKIAAEGIYLGRDKDSVWTYYSDFDGSVRLREAYSMGKLHGKSLSYYPGGEVSEEHTWEMDSREGPWIQYFEDETVRLKGNYLNNMLNGTYEVYYPGRVMMMSGAYVDDISEGTWNYYDDKGELLYTLDYKEGLPVDQEKYMKLMQDTLLRHDTIETPQPVQLF